MVTTVINFCNKRCVYLSTELQTMEADFVDMYIHPSCTPGDL